MRLIVICDTAIDSAHKGFCGRPTVDGRIPFSPCHPNRVDRIAPSSLGVRLMGLAGQMTRRTCLEVSLGDPPTKLLRSRSRKVNNSQSRTHRVVGNWVNVSVFWAIICVTNSPSDGSNHEHRAGVNAHKSSRVKLMSRIKRHDISYCTEINEYVFIRTCCTPTYYLCYSLDVLNKIYSQ